MYLFQPDRHLLSATAERWGRRFNGIVVDVGCGSYDRYSHHIRHSRYIRIDPSLENSPDAVGAAESVPIRSDCVDGIVCTQVLGDIPDAAAALREFHRVLRPEGLLFLTESQTNELHDEPRDYWRFTGGGLRLLCERAGFSVLELEARGGWAACVAQTAFRYLIDRFRLYQRRWLSLPFRLGFKTLGRLALLWDRIDGSPANRRHTIGWCLLAQKA